MIEDFLRNALAMFNEKREANEKLRNDLSGLDRTLLFKFRDGKAYHFQLIDGKAGELKEGIIENADIVIESDEETLRAIFSGELGAIKALALKKIKVDASIQDMLRIRNIF